MSAQKVAKNWRKTNVENLVKHRSGGYYARLYVAGKERWKSLRTTVLEVAKARLRDQQRDAVSLEQIARPAKSVHVLNPGLDALADTGIWVRAAAENRIVVSKDEDFFHLANRDGDTGRLSWVRIGNCRNAALLARFAVDWPSSSRHSPVGRASWRCVEPALNRAGYAPAGAMPAKSSESANFTPGTVLHASSSANS